MLRLYGVAQVSSSVTRFLSHGRAFCLVTISFGGKKRHHSEKVIVRVRQFDYVSTGRKSGKTNIHFVRKPIRRNTSARISAVFPPLSAKKKKNSRALIEMMFQFEFTHSVNRLRMKKFDSINKHSVCGVFFVVLFSSTNVRTRPCF